MERPFHPLANEYPLMADEQLAELAESIKANGQRKPCIMLAGQVLDGRNRWIAQTEMLKSEPLCEEYLGPTDEPTLREFVADANERRMHHEKKFLAARRRERVAARRVSGESLRSIAEAEGVSKSQVEADLSTVSRGVDTVPESGKVTGRDGVQQPAKKPNPLWCSRCNRMGVQAADCNACKTVRDEAEKKRKAKSKKKKKAEREEMKDKAGNVLPDNCRDAFADTGLPNLIEELEQAASIVRPQSWLDRSQKLTAHFGFILIGKVKEHAFNALESLQLAIEALRAGLPHAVCPKCNAVDSKNNGACCKGCRGFGFVPEHRYEELTRE